MKIAYFGNFHAPHSTEQQIARALERLGHQVLRQSTWDPTYPSYRREADAGLATLRPDVLIYTAVHSKPLGQLWGDVWRQAAARGCRTIGIHLDIFRGLDDRERRVVSGTDPQFAVQTLFTADGSPETAALFGYAGIDHRWMPPGWCPDVCTYDGRDFPGCPEIVFVGTGRRYHEEHPWRAFLLTELARRYGPRFGAFGQDTVVVRGEKLSRMIRSAKVVIGDCFDGGRRDYYWSDRVPETAARGGILVHPRVVGLEAAPLLEHEPLNLPEVFAKIDYALEADAATTAKLRDRAAEWAQSYRWDHVMRDVIGSL